MPSGYTASIYEGKDPSFRNFTLTCARAFGALIELRDEPMSADVPVLHRSEYGFERAMSAAAELAEVKSWAPRTARRKAAAAHQAELDYRQQSAQKRADLLDRYLDMLMQVIAWAPPTPEHEELRQFMIEQLENSIDFDCATYPHEPAVRLTGAQYQAKRIADLTEEIERSKERFADEVIRHRDRTQWIENLVNSLPGA
jgi:hypothetical protein